MIVMIRAAYTVLSRSISRMFGDEVLTLSAALAYYSLLSMAPLLLIAVSIAGVFFADGRVQSELVTQMHNLVGEQGAELTQTVIEHTQSEEQSRWSLLLGTVLTIVGSSTVFAQLQVALNRVWRVKAEPSAPMFMSFVRRRLLSFALVLSLGFLLMVSLVISAVLASVHTYLDERMADSALAWSALEMAVSFGVSTALIALIFKYLPDTEVEWRDSWIGAVVTAVLFTIGKEVIGLYLGQTTIASSFGAAGSVVVFMIWVYYAGLILLFGAEVTQAVASVRGGED
jgi:membrane protein